jgi:hypothetical protein
MPKPPTNQYIRELLAAGPFIGLDATTAPFYVEGLQGVDLLNVWPDRTYQSYVTAQGRVSVSTSLGNFGPLRGLGILDMSQVFGEIIYVAASQTGAATYALQYFYGNGAGFVGTYTLSSNVGPIALSNLWSFVAYASPNDDLSSDPGWLFISDGLSNALKITSNNTNITSWAIIPPYLNNPSSVAAGAGNLIGTYEWRVTYSNSSLESSPSGITAPLTLASQQATITYTPGSSVDPQATTVNFYRLGGTLSTWLFVGSVTSAGGGPYTFTDNIADTSVTGQQLILHRDPPADFLALESHMDCIWGFGYNNTYNYQYNSVTNSYQNTLPQPSDLWYSNYAEPWGFDNTNRILPCGRNTGGDYAVGLASIGSLLCALKTKTFWAVFGNSPSNFQQVKLFDIGCAARLSVTKAFGLVFWLSERGVFSFDGSDAPTYLSKDIKGLLEAFLPADLSAAVGFMHSRMYCIAFPTQNITLAVDIDSQKWYKLGWACNVAVWNPQGDPSTQFVAVYPHQLNQVLTNTVGGGQLDVWFAAETDLGNPISSHFTTRVADSALSAETKQYRYGLIEAPQQTGASVTFTTTVNGTNANSQIISLNGKSPRTVFSLPPSMVGHQAQITLSCSSSQKVQIDKAALYGYPKRRLIMTGLG